MLVMSRHVDDKFYIQAPTGEITEARILKINGRTVDIGFDAPQSVAIRRDDQVGTLEVKEQKWYDDAETLRRVAEFALKHRPATVCMEFLEAPWNHEETFQIWLLWKTYARREVREFILHLWRTDGSRVSASEIKNRILAGEAANYV